MIWFLDETVSSNQFLSQASGRIAATMTKKMSF